MIKIRNKLFAKKKKQPNNENCKHLYSLFRNRINREIKKSKKQYYAEYFKEHVNNIKTTWDGIKKFVNVKKNSEKISQLTIDGKVIDDDSKIATTFNVFLNVGPSTTKNSIHKVPNISPSKFLKNRVHVSNEEIIDIIKSLEIKSTGPYSIPLKMLTVVLDLIIIPLANIINMSFQTGEYPELLKVVTVIPIHKGGSTQDINNYRLISLSSIFDKIMEKLMHKKLYYFLEEHIILYQNQFGFRRNNSTVHALTNY